METKVEQLDGDKVKVTVTIDEKTTADAVKKQYKKVANQYSIPGFRRGKAPRPVIDSALGKDYVRAVVTDELVNDSYPLAVDQCGIYPVGKPEFGEEDMELVEDAKPYTFVFEVAVKPTLELSSYEPVSIELPSTEVTEESIDEEVENLLGHYSELVNAPANTKVKADNFVELKITATDDKGEPIASITTDETQYGLGSGIYPPAFDEELLGLKKGDTKQFAIDVPSESYAMTATLAGKTTQVHFDVEVLAVLKQKLPELTDEWVKEKIGVESVEELRGELREEIESQMSTIIPRLKESRILEALQERIQGEVPADVVEDAEAQLLQDFFTQLQRQGLTLDVYLKQQGITQEQFRDDVKHQAEDVSKQDMALDSYAVHQGMEATEEDIRAEFERAASDAAAAERMMDEWRQNGQMYLIRQGILRQKAAKELMDTAVVVTEEPKGAKKAKKDKKDKAEDDK